MNVENLVSLHCGVFLFFPQFACFTNKKFPNEAGAFFPNILSPDAKKSIHEVDMYMYDGVDKTKTHSFPFDHLKFFAQYIFKSIFLPYICIITDLPVSKDYICTIPGI